MAQFLLVKAFCPYGKRVMKEWAVIGLLAMLWNSGGGFGDDRGFPFTWQWSSDLGGRTYYSWPALVGNVVVWLIIILMIGLRVEAASRKSLASSPHGDTNPAAQGTDAAGSR